MKMQLTTKLFLTHAPTRTHTRKHSHTNTHTHTHTHTHTNTHSHTYTYTHTHKVKYSQVHGYIYTFLNCRNIGISRYFDSPLFRQCRNTESICRNIDTSKHWVVEIMRLPLDQYCILGSYLYSVEFQPVLFIDQWF